VLNIELVEGSERLAVDPDQDSLPPVSIGLYKAFMAKGKRGLEAFGVYSHLLFTYRLQRTNRVWATNTYLQAGLCIGERKVKAAKGLLARMGLIQLVRQKDERGRVKKTFVQLNLCRNPGPSIGAEIAPMEKVHGCSYRTGGSDRQMLPETMKCLGNEKKIPVSTPGAPTRRTSAVPSINFNFSGLTENWENIPDELVEKWQEAYPALNVERELLKAGEWLIANPTKRKKNYRRFLVNWLARGQERGKG
jgi:hypothetical protein